MRSAYRALRVCSSRRYPVIGISAAAMLITYALPLSGDEWSRFRGPNGSGQSDAAGIPREWTDDDYLWRIPLPGIGHSSPIVWQTAVYVTAGDPETGQQWLLQFDAATGQERWRVAWDATVYRHHKRNSFASCTPCADEQGVYLVSGSPDEYRLVALDHAGVERWAVTIAGGFQSNHGLGVSPIVYGERVIVPHEQEGDSALLAFHRETGREVWHTERNRERAAYSTPCVYGAGTGEAQLICNSGGHGISGVDPETGNVLWELPVFDKRSVSSPHVVGDLVLGSCGSGKGGNYLVAVRPGNRQGRSPEEVFKLDRAAPYVPTSVACGDLLFAWYDKGIVTCIDATDGTLHWKERVPGDYSASPIRIGDAIYGVSDRGDVVVLAASATFRELGRSSLGEPSRATPAVAGGRLFLRSESSLFAVGSP